MVRLTSLVILAVVCDVTLQMDIPYPNFPAPRSTGYAYDYAGQNPLAPQYASDNTQYGVNQGSVAVPTQPAYQPANQPTQPSYLPANQPAYQPTNPPVYQPANQPTQPANQPAYQPVNQPTQTVYQPTNPPVYQPTNQPVYQPANQQPQSVYQPTQPVYQPVQPVYQPVQPVYQPPTQSTYQQSQNQPSSQPIYSPAASSNQPQSQPAYSSGATPSKTSYPSQTNASPSPTIYASQPAAGYQPNYQPANQPAQSNYQPANQPAQSNYQPAQSNYQPTNIKTPVYNTYPTDNVIAPPQPIYTGDNYKGQGDDDQYIYRSQDDSYNYKTQGAYSPGAYACGYSDNGRTFSVRGVCFAFFECVSGEALYRQCNDNYRFKNGQCVADPSCNTACADGWYPSPNSISKFILGGYEQTCPAGTYFDYKICTCQHFYLMPRAYYSEDKPDY